MPMKVGHRWRLAGFGFAGNAGVGDTKARAGPRLCPGALRVPPDSAGPQGRALEQGDHPQGLRGLHPEDAEGPAEVPGA